MVNFPRKDILLSILDADYKTSNDKVKTCLVIWTFEFENIFADDRNNIGSLLKISTY